MPWNETTKMRERVRFIGDLERDLFSMTELCRRYGISRETGYKWVNRYFEEGLDGLKDRSRAPKRCPHRTDAFIVELLAEARGRHPCWGPKKLLIWLARRHRGLGLPAASTAGDILKRLGLVQARPRRRRVDHRGLPTTRATSPNQLWTADYKGQFKTQDGLYCYPLTVADTFSRYLLGCRALPFIRTLPTRAVFEFLFKEYGLPEAIRTDNGPPFATANAVGRLSRLSAWWIRLGIRPELIQPSHPEQNGSHERMHRTLKAETARPPAASLSAQQRKFERFRREYNDERPHEHLDQNCPSQLYAPSPRPYPDHLPEPEYPANFEVRRVSRNGGIRWKRGWVSVSRALIEENVGLDEVDDGIWSSTTAPCSWAASTRTTSASTPPSSNDRGNREPVDVAEIALRFPQAPTATTTKEEENQPPRTVSDVPGPKCQLSPRSLNADATVAWVGSPRQRLGPGLPVGRAVATSNHRWVDRPPGGRRPTGCLC